MTILYFNKEMMLQQQKFPVVILINEVFAVFCSRDNKFCVKMKNPSSQCVDYFLDVF